MISKVTAAEVGLDALRASNAGWLRHRLKTKKDSQIAFNQYIDVLNDASPAVPRSRHRHALAEMMCVEPGEAAVRAVLGPEGVGKTWLVADWWASQPEAPIVVMVAGRRSDLLQQPHEPLDGLAALLAAEQGSFDPIAKARWRRRLDRWRSQGADGRIRFVLVLDGLNETAAKPWADHLKGLAVELQALGGMVLITSRAQFWCDKVFARLRDTVSVKEITVGEYDADELRMVLGRAGVDMESLPRHLLGFLCNPRIAALAVELIGRLSADEITVPRLLFEYWRARLSERGDLAGHDVREMQGLLISHARAIRDDPRHVFSRAGWLAHSPATGRGPLASIYNDLTEIEEGRFLQIAAIDPDGYVFKPETMPFALGLLTVQELRAAVVRQPQTDADEVLAAILDAVRGFDVVASIVAAALGLACFAPDYPPQARSALICAWAGLQNISDESASEVAAYLAEAPDAFLDVIEQAEPGEEGRVQGLLHLVFYMRDHPKVQPAVARRLPGWLGSWSRVGRLFGSALDDAKRQEQRSARVAAALAQITPGERSMFDTLCPERSRPAALHLDRAAAILLASRPLAQFAPGLVGWALARTVAGDYDTADEELAWTVRLNAVDSEATESAVRHVISPFEATTSSGVARDARQVTLTLFGSESSPGGMSESAAPSNKSKGRDAWASRSSDTDPTDPGTTMPDSLENAKAELAGISPGAVWNHMSTTVEDSRFDDLTPVLARFDGSAMQTFVRAVAKDAAARVGMPLRQLSWQLPPFSPLLDEPSVQAVEAAYERSLAGLGELCDQDQTFVPGQLLMTILPHRTAGRQLDLLLRLPPSYPEWLDFRNGIKPFDPAFLEARLVDGSASGDNVAVRRILFMASCWPPSLTERTRELVASFLNGPDVVLSVHAAEFAFVAADQALDDLVLAAAAARDARLADASEDAFWRARSVAAAIIRRRRLDMLPHLSPGLADPVAVALKGAALQRLSDIADLAISRLLGPVAAVPPTDAQLVVEASRDGMSLMKRVEEVGAEKPADHPDAIRAAIKDWNDAEGSARRYASVQNARLASVHAYEEALDREDARLLAGAPPSVAGMALLGRREPDKVRSWLERIRLTGDRHLLRQVRNWGVVLAAGFAGVDRRLAADVMAHLQHVQPPVQVSVGDEQTPLWVECLFSAQGGAEIDALRAGSLDQALDDATLEMLVTAADGAGSAGWLDGYVADRLGTLSAGLRARGLMVAGLRAADPSLEKALAGAPPGAFPLKVAGTAKRARDRYLWTRHWLELTIGASTADEFWRFGTLAGSVADRRAHGLIHGVAKGPLFRIYGGTLRKQIRKASIDRTEKLKATLFGIKAPPRDLALMLADTANITLRGP